MSLISKTIAIPFIHFCSNPKRCEESEGTFGGIDPDSDEPGCGPYYCPFGSVEHLWHDGCPSCYGNEEQWPTPLVDLMLESAGLPIPDVLTYPAENYTPEREYKEVA